MKKLLVLLVTLLMLSTVVSAGWFCNDNKITGEVVANTALEQRVNRLEAQNLMLLTLLAQEKTERISEDTQLDASASNTEKNNAKLNAERVTDATQDIVDEMVGGGNLLGNIFSHMSDILAASAGSFSGGSLLSDVAEIRTMLNVDLVPPSEGSTFGDDSEDSDADGFTDAEEIEAGTDPNDPESVPGIMGDDQVIGRKGITEGIIRDSATQGATQPSFLARIFSFN